jgi:hypothetical protein
MLFRKTACCLRPRQASSAAAAAAAAAPEDVLATAGVDYSFVGDYSAFTEGDYGRLINPRSSLQQGQRPAPRGAYTEAERDYGQISIFPDSSEIVTSRTGTTLDNDAGR